MTKQQFNELAESLYKRDYKKYYQHWHNEDFVISKGFHRNDNKWEENRAACQLLISVYDWTDKSKVFYDRLPDSMKKRIGLEIHIGVSRTTDERIDLEMAWNEDTNIEDVEKTAESFYQWVCSTFPEPRTEES